MGHLDSQRSLPVVGSDRGGLSALTKKLRLPPEHSVAVLNAPDGYVSLLSPGPRDIATQALPGETTGATDLPATPWWMQHDVLGEITSVTGYGPVAFVAIDEVWAALRFKKV